MAPYRVARRRAGSHPLLAFDHAPTISFEDLVCLAKLRWRIERDYQELKDEIGLDHFEGRGWRGFHHHASLCIATYAFIVAERARISPPRPFTIFGLEEPAFIRRSTMAKRFPYGLNGTKQIRLFPSELGLQESHSPKAGALSVLSANWGHRGRRQAQGNDRTRSLPPVVSNALPYRLGQVGVIPLRARAARFNPSKSCKSAANLFSLGYLAHESSSEPESRRHESKEWPLIYRIGGIEVSSFA